ncbi:MAG TPA: MucB/RseB C-terminal domain-containing protein [Steroidobacteraceae bacterium]|jgi:sigma-E factor negative regulatory protein RseB
MSAAAEDDPFAWLVRTDQALATRNYEGVFVHEHAGESETLRVIHRVGGDGGVYERLLSMDGSGRECIRKGSQLTCYLPDQRTVLVEKSNDAGALLASLPKMETVSAGIYQVGELQKTRVSGRAAHMIAVTPMDQMRYGYRVWIDDSTAMPLKTQLRDAKGQIIEQIVFTDLRLPAHIADSELQPSVDAHNYRWVQHLADPADARALSVSWEASLLPPGFHMTVDARQVLRSGPVEHLVFSDGLASVSVFVDIGRESAAAPGTEDAATIGSSSAYSTVVQGYRVTAVGEVPPDTVRAIAQSIRAAPPTPSTSTSLLGGLGSPLDPSHRDDPGTSIFDSPSGARNPDTRFEALPSTGARVGLGPGPAGFGGPATAGPGRH